MIMMLGPRTLARVMFEVRLAWDVCKMTAIGVGIVPSFKDL